MRERFGFHVKGTRINDESPGCWIDAWAARSMQSARTQSRRPSKTLNLVCFSASALADGDGSKVRWHGRCHWQVRQELSLTAAREQPQSASYRQARVHPTGELPCKPSSLTIPVDDERSPNERHVASQLQRTLPPFSNNPPSRHPASRRQSQFTIGKHPIHADLEHLC